VDPYIDYQEVSVYGRYFYRQSEPLIGASELVNVGGVRGLVLTTVESVETELQLIGVPRSVERTGRDSVGAATEDMRDHLRRYFFHLQSLPVRAGVDVNAFFTGGKLGRVATQKPEDLLSQADAVLRGFTTPTSAALPDAARWQAELIAARETLNQAISGKLGAVFTASTGTSALVQARARFLVAYNKVAKRLIRGLLAELGREHELRRYFRDMQVNEEREIVGDVPDGLTGNDNDGTAAA
jgi:hypothetical protein